MSSIYQFVRNSFFSLPNESIKPTWSGVPIPLNYLSALGNGLFFATRTYVSIGITKINTTIRIVSTMFSLEITAYSLLNIFAVYGLTTNFEMSGNTKTIRIIRPA